MIEKAAERALRERAVNPVAFDAPTDIQLEFNRAEEADMCAKLITIERVDAYTLQGKYPTYEEAHRVIWNLIALSSQGLQAQH